MSDQGFYNQQSGDQNQHHFPSNNPWADQSSQQPQHNYQQPPQQGAFAQGYDAPPGPPPRRTDTFKETDFVPESERGEQREALEQFEINKGAESTEDQDIATLQQEYPGIDSSLIAALYGDSKSLSGTREMLQELSSGSQGS